MQTLDHLAITGLSGWSPVSEAPKVGGRSRKESFPGRQVGSSAYSCRKVGSAENRPLLQLHSVALGPGSRAELSRRYQPGLHSAAAAAKSHQSCLTLCDPIDGSPTGSSVHGLSRQEHWSGLPFPSPSLLLGRLYSVFLRG